MSQITITHEIEGVELEIIFHHQPYERETLECPEVVEELYVEQVLAGGVDIFNVLDDSFIASLVTDYEAGAIG